MRSLKINLLEPGRSVLSKRRRFSFWKGGLIAGIGLLLVVPTVFSILSLRLIHAAGNLNPDGGEKRSFMEQVRFLVGTGERTLKGEADDRINILALGEGGEGHHGAHLTDTVLFITIQPSTGSVGLLSLPRDLWVDLPGYGKGKINAANAYAEKAKTRSGGDYARRVVSDLLDQPIHYYVRVDFSAFKTLIDDVGGVTVHVDRTFTDFSYPTDDDLYQRVHFEKGWQTMNGETALKYVRSRHGNNGEGGDFARSRRQQKVMVSLKEKIVSFDTLLNPSRIASILETLENHVTTDLELWEIVKLAKLARNVAPDRLTHVVLDDGPDGLLYASTIPVADVDAYVLLPRKSDWSDVRKVARDIVFYRDLPSQEASRPAAPSKVEVLNGTLRQGLASKVRDRLIEVGYDVVAVGNAGRTDHPKTVIYDLTNGGSMERLATLKNLLGAEVAMTLPAYLGSGLTPSELALTEAELPKPSEPGTEFIIVLGNNHVN